MVLHQKLRLEIRTQNNYSRIITFFTALCPLYKQNLRGVSYKYIFILRNIFI